MVKEIRHNNALLAIIIPRNYDENGITFFTPDAFTQQLAYMKHPKGKTIQPHTHNIVKREVSYTKEVLFLRKGRLRVDFYTDEQEYIESHILESGDVILLASGGHGFEVLEELEMFEVKQGPYAGDQDKTRFQAIEKNHIKIEGGGA